MKIQKKLALLASAILLAFSSVQAAADMATAVDDSVITTKIKAKMLADKAVSSLNIGVETKDGVVTLSGNVKSDTEATAAVEIAASTPGVVDVDASKLAVQSSNQPLTDSFITAKIKGVYLREKVFGDKPVSVTGVHVETKDGVVYLNGEVENAAQAENAAKLAKTVKGVKDVISKLTVKS